ncbi:MAG TPA: methionyl-tRNA formyltransferase [Candidatus Paceibacterota bacterium]
MSHPFDNFVFFGSSQFSVVVLDTLKKNGFFPSLIITLPDSPSGRGMKLAPSLAKLWAIENKIDFIQPDKFDDSIIFKLKSYNLQLSLVSSYGKIIPKKVLDIPEFGSFNIHPSLLPKYRGPSPLQSQILADEKEVGVTVIKMDEEVDHGEILAQQNFQFSIFNFQNNPLTKSNFVGLGDFLFTKGTELFIENFPKLAKGEILKPQDDSKATFTKKFDKKDSEINLEDNRKSWLTYQALGSTLGVFFFVKHKDKNIRVKITEAEFNDGKFVPLKVIPEGKKEMRYEDFLRGIK